MFVQGGRGIFRKQMVLDWFFPPGIGEMEADFKLFSVIFTIGSNEKYPDAESLCNMYSFTSVLSTMCSFS